MAKKRSSRGQRENLTFASEAAVPVYLPSLPKSSLTDLRFYQPQKPKVSFDDLGRRSKILRQPENINKKQRPSSKTRFRSATIPSRLQGPLRERLSFQAPRGVLVCVRRKQRREVLFANKATGRGSRAKRHRNQFSNVRC